MKYQISTGEMIQIDEEDKDLLRGYKWAKRINNKYVTIRMTRLPQTSLQRLIGDRLGLKGPLTFRSEDRLDFRRNNIISQKREYRPVEAILLQKEKSKPERKGHCGRISIVFDGRTFTRQIPIYLKEKFAKELMRIEKLLPRKKEYR